MPLGRKLWTKKLWKSYWLQSALSTVKRFDFFPGTVQNSIPQTLNNLEQRNLSARSSLDAWQPPQRGRGRRRGASSRWPLSGARRALAHRTPPCRVFADTGAPASSRTPRSVWLRLPSNILHEWHVEPSRASVGLLPSCQRRSFGRLTGEEWHRERGGRGHCTATRDGGGHPRQ
jgi:hypothetical protein